MPNLRLAAVLLIGAAAFIQASPSFGQQDALQDMVIRINVDLVQVDAIVVDSEDRKVADLQAEDFNILQDGKPQKITHFSYVRIRSPKAPAAASKLPLPQPPQTGLKASQIRRTIALVVDDLGLSFDSTVRIRESLKKWMDTEMQPGDLVAVIRTGVGISALQQFTGDKRVLYAAIDRIKYNVAGRVAAASFGARDIKGNTMKGAVEAKYEELNAYLAKKSAGSKAGSEPAAPGNREDAVSKYTAMNDRMSTIASMGTIRYIVDGLKDVPGRKSVIIFSESLKSRFDYDSRTSGQSESDIFGKEGADQAIDKLLRSIVEAANRATVVIHVIDPRGLVNADTDAERNTGGSDYFALQDNMVRMSQETGGLFVRETNDLDTGLRTAVDDGNGYYLIGYQPDATVVEEMKKGLPKLHDIKVRVNRPGLRVRSRSRFFSVPSQDEPPRRLSQQEQIDQALASPFTEETLPVRLTPLFIEAGEEKPHVNALLHFDSSKLSFQKIEGDWMEASVDIVATTLDADGKQVDIAYKRGAIQARGKTYENMQKNGVAYLMHLPVKNPGSYVMRVVLYDNRSKQLGSATQFVDIPDVHNKRLALSGIVLATDKLQPKAFSQEEGVIAYENSNGTAAVRIFEPSDTIAWACQILNAKADSSGKPKLKVQVRLFHEGREMNPEKPLETASQLLPDDSRFIATGQMKLKVLLPGYYAMQLIISDLLADKDHQMAVQSMDFEIRAPAKNLPNAYAEPQNKTVIEMTAEELRWSYLELSCMEFNSSQDQLGSLLKEVGERVKTFFSDFSNVTSKERVRMQRSTIDLNKNPWTRRGRQPALLEANFDNTSPMSMGAVLSAEKREEFNYLILPGSGNEGMSWVEDRVDENNRPINQKAPPGFTMSLGYAGTCLFLHPSHQADSQFRYLGRDTKKPRAHVIAFAQKPGSKNYTQYSDVRLSVSTTIRFLVQGLVWIDPDTYQILRIRTSMLSPEEQTDLREQISDIHYERVQFDDTQRQFWLPREANVSWEFQTSGYEALVYRNQHKYSDYRLFAVESGYKITQPKVEK